MDELYEYLKNEWRYNNHPKYMKYFDDWYNNLTERQRKCYTIWMKGKIGPFLDD